MPNNSRHTTNTFSSTPLTDSDPFSTSDGRTYRHHSQFWRDHGSLVITNLDEAFKFDSSVLKDIQSPILSALAEKQQQQQDAGGQVPDSLRYLVIQIPEDLGITNEDLEAVFEHILSDIDARYAFHTHTHFSSARARTSNGK